MNSAQSFPGCDGVKDAFLPAANLGCILRGSSIPFHFRSTLSATYCTGVTEKCKKLGKKLTTM